MAISTHRLSVPSGAIYAAWGLCAATNVAAGAAAAWVKVDMNTLDFETAKRLAYGNELIAKKKADQHAWNAFLDCLGRGL